MQWKMSIEDAMEPTEVIENSVNKRNPHAAIRCADFCTCSVEIFSTEILKFGERGDMASARTVFEAFKNNLGCVNMYAYCTIIEVCGICHDHLQSRSIYKELSARKINPNYMYST